MSRYVTVFTHGGHHGAASKRKGWHWIIFQLVRFVFTNVFFTVLHTPHYMPCDNCHCCHWSLTAPAPSPTFTWQPAWREELAKCGYKRGTSVDPGTGQLFLYNLFMQLMAVHLWNHPKPPGDSESDCNRPSLPTTATVYVCGLPTIQHPAHNWSPVAQKKKKKKVRTSCNWFGPVGQLWHHKCAAKPYQDHQFRAV